MEFWGASHWTAREEDIKHRFSRESVALTPTIRCGYLARDIVTTLVKAIRFGRKMRGGSQAHLLEADDGYWYVVKFRNNPQHSRILVNELLASVFLDYLKITAPETAIVEISSAFLAANPDVHFTIGSRRVEIQPGWHFGSRYPGDPRHVAVYDFLPDALLPQVVNLDEFRAILVFDKWVGNADGRQSVFYRAMVRGEDRSHTCPRFVTRMIDHGLAFNGPNWDFPESPLQGLYARKLVYASVRSLDDFQPWLSLVQCFPEEVIDCAWKRVPADWIDDDEDALELLLERLFARRKQAPELIVEGRISRLNPFPNWQ